VLKEGKLIKLSCLTITAVQVQLQVLHQPASQVMGLITHQVAEEHQEVMGLHLQVLEEVTGEAPGEVEGAEGVTVVKIVMAAAVMEEVAMAVPAVAAAEAVTHMDHLEAAAVLTVAAAVAAAEDMVTAAVPAAAADMEAAVAAVVDMVTAAAAVVDLEAVVAEVVAAAMVTAAVVVAAAAEAMAAKTKSCQTTKYTPPASQQTSPKKTSLHFSAQLV